MSSEEFNRYKRFADALIKGDLEELEALTTETFSANLGTGLEKLNREQLLAEIARQKEGMPDLGKNVSIQQHGIDKAGRLVVRLINHATFTGTLRSRHPRGGSVKGDGRKVSMWQRDIVTFKDGEISTFQVIAESGDNFAQLFG
ncbi:MAG TPA: hypothetical protein VJ841_02505 [Candidatus Saccharimonadales bacterium]|nr:hypothetical protein [Candidatus Saccharimonadales bacterium]